MTKENQNVRLELEQTMRISLGKLIYKYRKEKGLSQLVLSNSLGIQYNVVQHWENASHKIPKPQLDRLRLLLDIPQDKLKVYYNQEGVLVNEEKHSPSGSRILPGLAERMKMLRAHHKFTIDNMALILNVTRSHYSRVENGIAMLTVNQFIVLHRIMKIPYEQLFGEEPMILSNLPELAELR